MSRAVERIAVGIAARRVVVIAREIVNCLALGSGWGVVVKV